MSTSETPIGTVADQVLWTTVTLQNSWANTGGSYGDASYNKDPLGVVRLRGAIHSGTTTNGTTILTLPSDCWPEHAKFGIAYTDDSPTRTWAWRVQTDGTLIIQALAGNTFVTLDAIEFRMG